MITLGTCPQPTAPPAPVAVRTAARLSTHTGLARRSVGELHERAGIDLGSVTAADALTVTTEFVTNALRHGGGLTLSRIAVTGNALHLSVGDASTHAPVSHPISVGQLGGYGRPLVERLAEHLTIRLLPDGKTIRGSLLGAC
ncbi:ATP-binding protein [Streptomyces erythrochromogenes]|uniref:ATP-binding protein n=1 Tax=Streptomyces erythrochromogenes TaxID=285574 RepID=UPI003865B6A4|nr:ATP-binding protein [Streptomyces erythrochromogenes]